MNKINSIMLKELKAKRRNSKSRTQESKKAGT